MVKRFVLVFCVTIAVALGAIALAAGTWLVRSHYEGERDQRYYATIEGTFAGLTRSDSYARLRAMNLAPHAVDGTGGWTSETFPQSGDVAIELMGVPEPIPTGACGAWALLVLHYQNERIAKIDERVWPGSCM